MNGYEILILVNALLLIVTLYILYRIVRVVRKLLTNLRYAKDIATGRKQLLTTQIQLDMVMQGPKKDTTLVTRRFKI